MRRVERGLVEIVTTCTHDGVEGVAAVGVGVVAVAGVDVEWGWGGGTALPCLLWVLLLSGWRRCECDVLVDLLLLAGIVG